MSDFLSDLPWWGWLILVAVLTPLLILGYRLRAQRNAEFARTAERAGFTWVERDDAILPRFEDMGDPFDSHRDLDTTLTNLRRAGQRQQPLTPPRAANVMTGSWEGRPAVAFEYRFTARRRRGDRDRLETRSIGVACLTTELTMPDLSIRPESILGRAVGKVLGNDIELESEAFNRAFTVTSPDRRFASDFLDPRMMELMLTKQKAGVLVRGNDLVRITNGRMEPAQLRSAFGYLDEILGSVPDHVRTACLPSTPAADRSPDQP